MVEGVHRAPCAMFTKGTHHERLDGRSLDLDVDHNVAADSIEYRTKCGDFDAFSERYVPELGGRGIGDATPGKTGPVDDRVVVHYHCGVIGRVHIELDRIGAEL